jgi:hypothetical protein
MEEIIQRLLKDNFSELAGLTMDASIPFPEGLINEFVQSVLQGNKNIKDLYIAIHSGNYVAVNLKTQLWPLPINLKLRLEPSVDFANGATVRASLENFVFLGKLGAIFKAFPPGITLEDDQIIVDIESFLKDPQQRRWLELIQSMQIRTEEAKAIMDIRVEVK